MPITVNILVLQHYHHQDMITFKPEKAWIFKGSFLPPKTYFFPPLISYILRKIKNKKHGTTC